MYKLLQIRSQITFRYRTDHVFHFFPKNTHMIISMSNVCKHVNSLRVYKDPGQTKTGDYSTHAKKHDLDSYQPFLETIVNKR